MWVDIRIPISGPKGEGTIHVRGKKQAGTWTYERMAVVIVVDPEKIVTNDLR